MSQFGLREAIYSKEAGRFEVKCNEFGETARQLLESEVSLNIPSYVKLLYLTNCVADTPVTGIFSFFLCIGHLYFNEVNPDTGIQSVVCSNSEAKPEIEIPLGKIVQCR